MIIQGINYNVMDVFNNFITLPDSFAAQGNKYGKGHGEAKLYVGSKPQMNNFFGNYSNCFVLKKDFEDYMNSLRSATGVLSSIYKNAVGKNKNFNTILNAISNTIAGMNPVENFNIRLMNNLQGPRGYINSTTNKQTGGYYYLRACCVPFVSFIRIMKLQDTATGNVCFYMKIFPNFDEMYQQVQFIKKYGKKNLQNQVGVRSGQSKYKRNLVQVFNECPFTHIKDERLLVASHIQPYASCNGQQKYDVENGLLLSPLYDKLFDRGFITFDQQGILRKTIWLSSNEWQKIPLNYAIQDLHLTPQRIAYLRFHEAHVFLGD